MTVSTTTNQTVAEGNDVAVTFDFPFKVLDEAHLIIQRQDSATETVNKTYIGSEFTVAGVGEDSGTVTFEEPPASGQQIVITRVVPLTQDLDIVNSSGFYPETVEEQLDLIVMGLQQLGGEGTAADNAVLEAQLARNEAQGARDGAETAETGAEFAQTAAEAAQALAETAAAAALLNASDIYADTATGLAAVAEGEYFYVQDGDGNLQLYQDVAGVAVAQDFVAPSVDTINAALTDYLRFDSPFIQDVTDVELRAWVEDIRIEGGDPGHVYLLNIGSSFAGGSNYRFSLRLRDVTLGINVAEWVQLDTQANFLDRANFLSNTVMLNQGGLATYSGITATVWINWAIITFAKVVTTYTLAAEAGIRSDRVLSPKEIRERFKRGAEPKIKLTVGAGATSDTHFNTVLAAVQSLYIPGLTVTRSGPFPLSDICSFSNQVVVEVIDDAYDEAIALVSPGGIDQSPLVLPPFCTLRGLGMENTRLYVASTVNTGPVVETPFPFRIESMEVENLASGYAVHIDNVNALAKRSTVVGDRAILRYSMVSVFYKAKLSGSAATTNWVIGCGISNGQTIRLDGCQVTGANASPLLGVHNSPTTVDGGEIEVVDCVFNDAAVGAIGIQLLKSFAMTAQHTLKIANSDVGSISVGAPVSGAAGYRREGKIDATITGDLA